MPAVPLCVGQKVSSGKDVEGDGQPHQTPENPTPTSYQTLWEHNEEGRGSANPPLPPLRHETASTPGIELRASLASPP